jgi:excinuclease ABC subunit C
MDYKKFPSLPGVYIFKNAAGDVLYIGKARNLKNRIATYFVGSHDDWKMSSLLEQYKMVEYIITKNEIEAMLLEVELIKTYQPHFNTLLKDGDPFLYLGITTGDEAKYTKTGLSRYLPQLVIVRRKDEVKFKKLFGPFIHKKDVRFVYNYLMITFRLTVCNVKIEEGCLHYHLGQCAGTCKQDFSVKEYQERLMLAQAVLSQNYKVYEKTVQKQIAIHNKNMEFESAQYLTDYLQHAPVIFETIKTRFSASQYFSEIIEKTAPVLKQEIPVDIAIQAQKFLHVDKPIMSIDCFDVSHFQSSYIVGFAARFVEGKSSSSGFRKFLIHGLQRQNDYAALQEIVVRRYAKEQDYPDLILIDGGKGQLHAVRDFIPTTIPVVALAKKEEKLYIPWLAEEKTLSLHDPVGRLLIALRDYAHHGAVSYHKLLRKKGILHGTAARGTVTRSAQERS